ncbi:MAG: RidA family protein [Gammaproteobacteria bacterium]|nr:RidA family protein [Gammaproteobacteria bacterium]
MSGRIDARLAELGLTLPETQAPRGNYIPVVISGRHAWVAGQVPLADGEVRYRGRVGADLSVEDGQAAARICALNILAQLKRALDGDLDRVRRIVKVGGFVACAADFSAHPQVVNGASDLFVEIFGDAGRHARFAVGAASLPLGSAVEVDAVIEID